MGTIIGKGFQDFVINQIDIRQEKLGLTDRRDDDLLKYINNKTSWLRLTSGVNVSKSKTAELGLQGQEGNILAKNNVLSNARPYTNTNKPIGDWEGQFTSGIGYNDLSSYGYQSGPDYGLVPPPGLKSAEVKSLNGGSLREANIQITCHNYQQFKIIETLYLRLGYSILLEWGHTFWYDNTGGLRSDMPDWVHQGFLKGDYHQDDILNILTKHRKQFDGNYDGFFGVVVNFDWDLRTDGGYDINIRAQSVGSIIESLKINNSFPLPDRGTGNILIDGKPISEFEGTLPSTIADANRSTLNYMLYIIRGILETKIPEGKSDYILRSSLNTNELAKTSGIRANYKLLGSDNLPLEDDPNNPVVFGEIGGYGAVFPSIFASDDNSEVHTLHSYYIPLGTLLRIIENFLNIIDTTTGVPLFHIDYDFKNNLCFTIPRQLSVDPNICLIPTLNQNLTFTQTAAANNISNQYIEIITTEVTLKTGISGINPLAVIATATAAPFVNEKTQSRNIVSSLPDGYTLGVPKITTEETLNNPFTPQKITTTTTVYYSSDSTPDQLPIAEDQAWWKDVLGSFLPKEVSIDNVIDFFGSENENYNNLINIPSNTFRTDSPFIGKTMGILVNLDYISSVIDSNVDNDGKVSLYKLLNPLMSGIQTALGNVNKFEVIYTAETNTFSIIDKTYIPGVFDYLKLPKPKVAEFNPNLLKPNYGSFATDVSIKSQLDNKFAASITIGAQANGNKVGENATAFSKWNIGLTDRIIKVKANLNDPSQQTPTDIATTSSISPEEAYKKNIEKLFEFRVNVNNGKVTPDDISNYKQSVVDVFQYDIGFYSDEQIIPGIGFIPLNLQLTLDGLSGIRIFEVYTIDETLLPGNYRDNIQFMTRGVSHKIDENGWKTTLESLSGPKEKKVFNIASSPIQSTPANSSTTNIKKAEKLIADGNCDSLPSNRFNVVEKILQEANKYGIKDKNRLTCLLTVAYAEARFDLRKVENFKYRVDRIGTGTPNKWNGDASIIFKDSLRKAGVNTDGLKKILNNPSDSLANYVYANKGENKGPSSGDGFKYRGRGITQTTFKSNYQTTQNALKKYNINIDLISNPDNIFQYEIPVLVIGKLEGLYGKKLSASTDYINSANNIAQTQNGGKKAASDNYIGALRCINSNSKIQELISKYS